MCSEKSDMPTDVLSTAKVYFGTFCRFRALQRLNGFIQDHIWTLNKSRKQRKLSYQEIKSCIEQDELSSGVWLLFMWGCSSEMLCIVS